MSLSRSNRPLRLSPTLALLVGLGGGLSAADFATTVTVPASQTPGGVYVVKTLPVTFTVNFAETVVPGYLTGGLALNASPTVPLIYDVVNRAGSNATTDGANTTITMVDGRTMTVQMAGLTNGQVGQLAIVQGRFEGVGSDGTLTGNVNAAVSAVSVRYMLGTAYAAQIDTQAYAMFETGGIILSGDFSDLGTPDFGVNPLFVDYVVKVTGGGSPVNAYTLASGAWTAIVPPPDELGRRTLTATPTDIVESFVGTGVTRVIYVGQKPAITLAQVTVADTAPYDTAFTDGMLVGHGKPGFTGTAGLPRDVDGTIDGTIDAAGGRIRTRVDLFGADPIADPSTPPLIPQKVFEHLDFDGALTDTNAVWTLDSDDYGATTLTAGTKYLRVVTSVWDADGATGGDVTGIGTFQQVFTFTVNLTAPGAPIVDLDTVTGGAQGTFTTADNTPDIGIGLAAKTLNATNVQVQYKLDTTVGDTVTGDPATGWAAFTVNSTSLPGSGADVVFTPIVGEALADGIYKVRAIFTDTNGLSATTATPATLTIGTPVPTLVVTSGAADHKPSLTVALSSGTPTQGSIEVQVKASAAADGTFATRAGFLSVTAGPVYSWTPTVPLPDGAYTFRARWTSPDNKTSAWTTVPATVTITTPTPVLAADGFAGANVSVLAASSPLDGNNQYLVADLKPKIKVGAWADFAPANGTFEMYQVSRGTSGVQITPYTLANDTAGHLITNNITPGATPGALIAGTVTNDGGDAVWTPDDALTNEGAYSLFAKWTDAKAANATADDSDAANGDEAAAVALASNVFNLRVLSAVDAPALTGYSPHLDDDDTPDTAYTGTSIVVADGRIQIHGTGNAFATLQMFQGASRETQLASITVPANGKWVYEFSEDEGTPAATLPAGGHFLSFRQVDLASETPGPFAPQITVNVSADAPATPVITEIEDSATDGVKTADTTPEFEGTASPGSTVNLYAKAATQLVSAVADNDLQFVAKNQGFAITLSLVRAGNNTPLSVVTTGTAPTHTVTVNVATGAGGASTSTANDIVNAVRANATASGLISIALAGSDAGNLGTGLVPVTASPQNVVSNTGTLDAAGSALADVSTGAWATDPARVTPLLTAAAAPGLLHRVFAQGVSPSAVTSGYSDGRDLYIVAPSMKVYLEPVARGDGGGYLVNKTGPNYPVGTSIIALDTGTETVYNAATPDVLEDANGDADVLVGDVVQFTGDPNLYTVTTGLRGAAGTIRITPGLRQALANDVAMTILPNPKGPTSKGRGNTNPTSLSQIQLVATFVDGAGAPIDEVTTADFPTSKVAITGGTVTSVAKGTGQVGRLATNQWTLLITPSTTDGLMTVSIPEGRIGTSPKKIMDAITITNPGAHYVGTPTFRVNGGATNSAVLAWNDANGNDQIETGELTITDPGYGFNTSASISVIPSPGSGAAGLAMTVNGGGDGALATVTGATPSVPVLYDDFDAGTIAATTLTFPARGSGYAAAPAVVFTGGTAQTGETIVYPVATSVLGGTNGAQVVGLRFTNLGSEFATPPTMAFRTGSGFTATVSLKDGQVFYNEDSKTFLTDDGYGNADEPSDLAYTVDVDRTKPKAAWKYVAADAAALRIPIVLDDDGNPVPPIDGVTAFAATGNYVIVTGSETSFTIQADFGGTSLNRDLVATDLTLVGCSLVSITDASAGTRKKFNIKVQRGGAPASATTMSVTVKAAPRWPLSGGVILSDTAEPAQASLASAVFAATVVSTPAGPVITSTVGSPSLPARTVSYPVRVAFSTPVTGFSPRHLKVTNGVISRFAGTGRSYTFTLTPGEGPVSVQYLQSALAGEGLTALQDVAQQLIPDSNVFQRTLDSTQPVVDAVSSPVFGAGGAVKATNFTPVTVSGVAMAEIPLRLTFSEAPKSVPTASLLATYVTSGAATLVTPATLVAGTANKVYEVKLRIPQNLVGKVRVVVPALTVPDNANNQGAASGVFELNFDMVGGTPVNVATAPFSNG